MLSLKIVTYLDRLHDSVSHRILTRNDMNDIMGGFRQCNALHGPATGPIDGRPTLDTGQISVVSTYLGLYE